MLPLQILQEAHRGFNRADIVYRNILCDLFLLPHTQNMALFKVKWMWTWMSLSAEDPVSPCGELNTSINSHSLIMPAFFQNNCGGTKKGLFSEKVWWSHAKCHRICIMHIQEDDGYEAEAEAEAHSMCIPTKFKDTRNRCTISRKSGQKRGEKETPTDNVLFLWNEISFSYHATEGLKQATHTLLCE